MLSPRKIVMLGGDEALVRRFEQATQGYPCIFQRIASTNHPLSQEVPRKTELAVIVVDKAIHRAIEQLQALRRHCPRIKSLLVLSQNDQHDIVRAFEAGADGVLLDPFTPEQLSSKLQRFLRTDGPASISKAAGGWMHRILAFLRSTIFHGTHRPAEAHLGLLPHSMYPLDAPRTEEDDIPDLYVRFFGKLEIKYQGRPLELPAGAKTSSLLAYLLYNSHRTMHPEKLMTKFWGDSTTSSARNSLHVAFNKIRKLFRDCDPDAKVLLYELDAYHIDPRLVVRTDVEEFLEQWNQGRAVEQSVSLEAALPHYNRAATLYKGDFLEHLFLEEWCASERENLKETYLLLLNRLSDYFFQKKLYTASIEVCRKILDKDPCLEETHRRLMYCYWRMGMRDKAIKQYYTCGDVLAKELSVKSSDVTHKLFVEICEG